MRKNKKYSNGMFWITCVFLGLFVALCFVLGPLEKKQKHRLQTIESCLVVQVKAVSFDRQNKILTVLKSFGDGHFEKSSYCLSLLPVINADNERRQQMFEIVIDNGKTVVFDLNGNAWQGGIKEK